MVVCVGRNGKIYCSTKFHLLDPKMLHCIVTIDKVTLGGITRSTNRGNMLNTEIHNIPL